MKQITKENFLGLIHNTDYPCRILFRSNNQKCIDEMQNVCGYEESVEYISRNAENQSLEEHIIFNAEEHGLEEDYFRFKNRYGIEFVIQRITQLNNDNGEICQNYIIYYNKNI